MWPMVGVLCVGVGIGLAGQLFVTRTGDPAWYRYYLMVVGAAVLAAGLEVVHHPETELEAVLPMMVLPVLLGSIGISIGIIRRKIDTPE